MQQKIAVARLLRQAGDLRPEDTATQRKHILSLMLYIAAIPLAQFHPHVALGAITLVTVIWILPTMRSRPRADDRPL